MVGAMIVAGIETVWGGRVKAHQSELVRDAFGTGEQTLAAGGEMGRFFLGSTVVLLFEQGRVEWLEQFVAGESVRMGQALGRWL